MHISHRSLHYTARLQVPAVFELGKQILEVMPQTIGSAIERNLRDYKGTQTIPTVSS
ncbi:hypothetical protein H3V17_01920 [Bartonella sp. M0283]|uniref:hypothetical protein n=1 Tax=Bartonella sp. M0283 TaxID=2751016 RepID=UPI0018DD2766|nr:hypothetical protein [Bartonella sp. M0283]MBI0162407.1 hypothetical protein [Bartonella sp. M0283]